jgi:hypothetical protein
MLTLEAYASASSSALSSSPTAAAPASAYLAADRRTSNAASVRFDPRAHSEDAVFASISPRRRRQRERRRVWRPASAPSAAATSATAVEAAHSYRNSVSSSASGDFTCSTTISRLPPARRERSRSFRLLGRRHGRTGRKAHTVRWHQEGEAEALLITMEANIGRTSAIQRLGTTQGVDGISTTVRAGRCFISRPPPGVATAPERRRVPAAPCVEPPRSPCWRPPVGPTGHPASGAVVMGGELRERAGTVYVESDGGTRAGGGGAVVARCACGFGCSERAHSQPIYGGCVSHSVLKPQRLESLESDSLLLTSAPHVIRSAGPCSGTPARKRCNAADATVCFSAGVAEWILEAARRRPEGCRGSLCTTAKQASCVGVLRPAMGSAPPLCRGQRRWRRASLVQISRCLPFMNENMEISQGSVRIFFFYHSSIRIYPRVHRARCLIRSS